MKKHLILIIFLFYQTLSFAQKIEFFCIGWDDHPLTNLVIFLDGTTEELGPWYRGITLSDEGFSLVKNYVLSKDTNKRPAKGSYHKDKIGSSGFYPYGTYAILYTNSQDTIAFYCLENGKKSAKYFEDLISMLNEKEGVLIATFIYKNIFSNISFLLELPSLDKNFLQQIQREYSCESCIVSKIIIGIFFVINVVLFFFIWRKKSKKFS